MSAAALAAGLAVASAQNAPGGAGARSDVRGQHGRTAASAVRKAEPPERLRATGAGLLHGSQRGSERWLAPRSESLLAFPRGARGVIRPSAKQHDAVVQPPRGRSGRIDPSISYRYRAWDRPSRDRTSWDRMSWDRTSLDRTLDRPWNRAAGQAHLRLEQEGPRQGRRQPALPFTKERGQQDLGRSRTPRHPSEQAGRSHSHAHSVAQPRGDAADAGRDQVRQAQAALNQHGFNVGDPDGKLGKRTKEALIAFQKQRGFRPTGKVDRATLQALLAGEAAPGGTQGSQPGPVQAAPQGPAPATTGQAGTAQGAGALQPADADTPPAPEIPPMPETGASGRVPAGSPQEDYKEDDQR